MTTTRETIDQLSAQIRDFEHESDQTGALWYALGYLESSDPEQTAKALQLAIEHVQRSQEATR